MGELEAFPRLVAIAEFPFADPPMWPSIHFGHVLNSQWGSFTCSPSDSPIQMLKTLSQKAWVWKKKKTKPKHQCFSFFPPPYIDQLGQNASVTLLDSSLKTWSCNSAQVFSEELILNLLTNITSITLWQHAVQVSVSNTECFSSPHCNTRLVCSQIQYRSSNFCLQRYNLS